MILIQKKAEPAVFLEYRMREGARFDDMPSEVKEKLRQSLLKEQGYLCAYCMCRIEDGRDVKIEHFAARTPENELDYHNLLAVCRGGEGLPFAVQHCDTKKGNRQLFISPLKIADMSRIFYRKNGEIHSQDNGTQYRYDYQKGEKRHQGCTTPDGDLSDCLNLNAPDGSPMRGRKKALKSFQMSLSSRKDEKGRRVFLEKMRQYYVNQNDKKQPYIGILLWYINKKLPT